MAHTPGHLDESLLAAGQAGAVGPERRNPRPSLLGPTSQNLFGEIEQGQGGRQGDFIGRTLGGLFPPSGKQQAALKKLFEERAETLQRARVNAASEFAEAAGISPQAAGMGGGFDPRVRAGLEATARQEPGGREALGALATEGPRGALARQTEAAQLRLALAESTSRLAMLPLANQEIIDSATRDATAFRIKNFKDFSAEVRGNVSLQSGVKAATAFQQLVISLENEDATELDIQSAIVALAQILEPGLAVRNDDRIAITGAASPMMDRLIRGYNQAVSGNVDVGTFRANAIRSATSLMKPRAEALRQGIDFFDNQIAPGIPGVQAGDASNILGITPGVIETINRVAPISDFDFTE